MASREQVLAVISKKGPLLPALIAKEFNMPLLFAQAHLSDLSSQHMVRLSHIKLGGSPLYYLQGQESSLQNYAEKLGEKDKRVYERLKAQKVMRDVDVDPLTRVSLRNLKDFATMLEVKVADNIEIFWKWYLLSNEEIKPFIQQMLEPQEQAPAISASVITATTAQTVPLVTEQVPSPAVIQAPITPVQDPSPKVHSPTTQDAQPLYLKIPAQKMLVEPAVDAKVSTFIHGGDSFIKELFAYFAAQKIGITECVQIRKNAECEFVLDVPSAIGNLSVYCRAKNKKKCTEGDLSVAYLEGQARKLPVYFIGGEVPKKLEAQLPTKYKGMILKKI